MQNTSLVTPIVIIILVLLCCCLCVAAILFGGLGLSLFTLDSQPQEWSVGPASPTPVVVRPTVFPTQQIIDGVVPTETPDDQSENQPLPELDIPPAIVSTETLETLENTIIPINDLVDLARRLEGKTDIPATIEPPAEFYQVGEQQSFWMTNVDTNRNFEIQATLQYVTDHAYFWIEDGIEYDANDLSALAETFENQIYPTDREFFGSEWSPGVDGDPHLYIIFAENLGFNLAGYFSAADEFHPLAHEYSNAHETFVLNADNVAFDEEYTYSTLAHEFQHMIHWYRDRNESTWLNEGFSELASFLNGFDTGGFDYLYTRDPDLQLNDWPNDSSQTSPHYGASFLFVTYFLDRFGDQATQALVEHPNNGMTSVDDVLAENQTTDPLTGEAIGADDVFLDWVLATFLMNDRVGDGRYFYHNYPTAPANEETETIYNCPSGPLTRDVSQYGADYIRIDCAGVYNLHFEGSIQVGVVPANPHSGQYAFWSNKGDESDMTLTQSFDFTNVSGPLSLTFWTWYDLEEDYDYLYLEASSDGETWQILDTPSGTSEDPSGNSYGWGYNGLSGGDGSWIQETVDLSQFAGQQIQIRFEYVTDAAVNGEGLLLDDIAIPEIDYFSDFESDSGGWEAAGFVKIQNILPQTYRLALIYRGADGTRVEYVTLSADNVADIELNLSGNVDDVTLVVTGTTRFTRQKAAYRFEISP